MPPSESSRIRITFRGPRRSRESAEELAFACRIAGTFSRSSSETSTKPFGVSARRAAGDRPGPRARLLGGVVKERETPVAPNADGASPP